jgi:phenylalanine-4-hydroxylase
LASNDPKLNKLMETLKQDYENVQLIGSPEVPWFPRRPADIDRFSQQTLDAGEELQADHPGFSDPEYRERRAMIAEIAKNFRQ